MSRKTPFMGTTEVPVLHTVGEIQALLVQAGARHIGQQYDDTGKIDSVSFTLEVAPGMVRYFQLPARVDPVFKLINGSRAHQWDRQNAKDKDRAQAERVAWRQLFRWLQAQLAMVQCGMVEAAEVFLPYMTNDSGKTLFESWKESELRMLPAAGESSSP